MLTPADNSINQSKLEANSCNLHQTLASIAICVHTSCNWFITSDLLRGSCQFSVNQSRKSKANPKQTQISFDIRLQTVLKMLKVHSLLGNVKAKIPCLMAVSDTWSRWSEFFGRGVPPGLSKVLTPSAAHTNMAYKLEYLPRAVKCFHSISSN